MPPCPASSRAAAIWWRPAAAGAKLGLSTRRAARYMACCGTWRIQSSRGSSMAAWHTPSVTV